MKTILVFQNGELVRQIQYKTKAIAKKQLSWFKKYGIIDVSTGEVLQDTIFELI